MKFIDFIRKHPNVLIFVNVPILMVLVECLHFNSEISEVIFIVTASFILMIFERFLLNAFRPKLKHKSIEELIDESWAQYRKEKQVQQKNDVYE